jgi:hypothetical protein
LVVPAVVKFLLISFQKRLFESNCKFGAKCSSMLDMRIVEDP